VVQLGGCQPAWQRRLVFVRVTGTLLHCSVLSEQQRHTEAHIGWEVGNWTIIWWQVVSGIL